MRARAVLADLAVVVVFVVIGRHAHDHGLNPAGVVSTTWPFACGLALGWLVLLLWGRTGRSLPDGIGITLVTVAAGMVLRVLAGQGTAVAFVLVALAFLGLLLLGWRAVVLWAWRRSRLTAG